MEDKVRDEIEALHRFFVDWFRGAQPDTDEAFDAGFKSRLATNFHYVMPDGSRFDQDGILTALRGTHGTNPDFAITISDVHVHAQREGLIVASYIEWQAGARESKSPENGRISTAVLSEDETAPGGLRWQHVHETRVPPEMEAHNPLLR